MILFMRGQVSLRLLRAMWVVQMFEGLNQIQSELIIYFLLWSDSSIIKRMTDLYNQHTSYDSVSQASTDGDDLNSMPLHQNNKKHPNTKNSKAKSSLCKNYSEHGFCPYGYKCQFAHGVQELRCKVDENSYKTKTCNAFIKKGYCKYGFRCNFQHQHTNAIEPTDIACNYRDILYETRKMGTSRLNFSNSN